MGKRSSFKRRPQDAYDTPAEAVEPVLPYLPRRTFTYCDPCAGRGALVSAMPEHAVLNRAFDIKPRVRWIAKKDATQLNRTHVAGTEYIITNPPWTRTILHPLIERFSDLRPTWLLFDADWIHTKQATPYLKRCRKIVSIGRVRWIPGSPHVGKDNACWYLFDSPANRNPVFIGRT